MAGEPCDGIVLVLLTFILQSSGALHTEHDRYEDAGALITRLLNSSDNRIRPNINGPPVEVACDIFVQEFGPIDEVNMDFGMEIFFRQRWNDSRLKYTEKLDYVVIPAMHLSQIWIPDTYFPNERAGSVHDVMSRNEIVKVLPGGMVRHSARLTLRLACSMYLVHFPLDYQDCHIKISSYSYTKEALRYHWWARDPIENHRQKSNMPQFTLLKTSIEALDEEFNTGTFSTLIATFHLKRQVGFYVLQSYVPSILIVVLSWVSFWVNKEAVPARITLGVTTVLTMTTQLTSSRSNSMRVSYPKAIDVWYSWCMLCVFGALLEFAVVNVLSRKERKVQKRADCENDITVIQAAINTGNDDPEAIEEIIGSSTRGTGRVSAATFEYQKRLKRNLERLSRKLRRAGIAHTRKVTAQGLDKISRIVFPAAFILFNVVYWIVYTQPVVFGFK